MFLGLSLVGAEWVLYLLILMSVFSGSIMIGKWLFYRGATKALGDFRSELRSLILQKNWSSALKLAESRAQEVKQDMPDLETEMAKLLLQAKLEGHTHAETLNELANDGVQRAKIRWDQGLSNLATIGNNAPFVGLFGTVLGIIKAFHDLSKQAAGAAASVTAGISEALIATAVGILVAIPAVVAYNYFQRRNKVALGEAEALKSFLVGKISGSSAQGS
jgi:biopolymer transport protein ExbB